MPTSAAAAPRLPFLIVALIATASPVRGDDERPFGLGERVPFTTSKVHGTPEPPPPFVARRLYEKLKFDQPLHVMKLPTAERYLVVERDGKILSLTPDQSLEKPEVYLDTGRETYSIAFHPNFAENGRLFTFTNAEFEKGAGKRNRISRFIVSQPKSGKPDPETETVILEWASNGHNGHYLDFGPDGMLWITAGDGTVGMDPKLDGQDVSNVRGTLMRIDVDHPSADGRPYSIPRDNPFVNRANTRPEIWAFGFRNPYRFAFDPRNDNLYVADIGQDAWEMIYRVTKGGNYGWSIMEGPAPLNLTRNKGPGPLIPPVVSHPHSEMRSITGGVFYRGRRFPELRGVYVYGDYDTRRLFGVRFDDDGRPTRQRELARTTRRIISIGEDARGELMIAGFGEGELLTIDRRPAEQIANHDFPRKLSQTGLFDSVRKHAMAPGVIPYSVNSPLWSDGAHKRRFMAVPGTETVGYRDKRAWNFPKETVLVKTFSLDMTEGDPATRRHVETRLMHLQPNGEWAGYSYRWNDEQTDASLVAPTGRDETFTITDPAAEGGRRRQTWRYPSRAECMVCHTREARYVLGLSTLQMNRDHDYGDVTDNQLRTLAHIGLFEKAPQKPHAELPALPDPYDAKTSLDGRARSYLHANCFHCHVENGGGNAEVILEWGHDPAKAKLVDAIPRHIDFGLKNARLIAPGSVERSTILHRLERLGKHQMPPVARNRIDTEAVEMLKSWVLSLETRAEQRSQ